MKLSTKTRYSLRALTDLAIHQNGNQPILLKDIAHRENISVKYLEALFSSLRKSGLIISQRGAHGGYLLAKKPEEITILNIIEIFDGPFYIVDCLNINTPCKDKSKCSTENIYQDINQQISDIFNKYTIKKLMKNYQAKKATSFMYNI
jgi:Rrf2 family transcriptional regulator, cysteine metabolism repressor